jgi:hypothetical protein
MSAILPSSDPNSVLVKNTETRLLQQANKGIDMKLAGWQTALAVDLVLQGFLSKSVYWLVYLRCNVMQRCSRFT